MIDADKRKAVILLHREGMKVREISRRFGISRNSVRAIIIQKGVVQRTVRKDKIQLDPDLVRRLGKQYNQTS
jgi:transposase-like protein